METRDYSKFKFLNTNRGIHKSNVERIKASIKEWGIIPGRPILVDGDYNIIDGQHRFLAIKELGHPIPYEVINGDTISKTMTLNSSQMPWQLVDFVKSYAEQGNDNYRRMLKFEEKYKLGFTSSLYICFGYAFKSADIKAGKHLEFVENAEEIAQYLENINFVSYRTTKSFIWAVINLFKKTNEEQREIIKDHILKIPQFSNHTDYRTAFENILNYKKKNNFTRL